MYNFGKEIAGIKMKNPVMNASGTSGLECMEFFDLNCMGAYIPKTITLLPRIGNLQPRIFEVPGGLINAVGLQNDGLEKFKEDFPNLQKMIHIPIIVSLAGNTEEEYLELVDSLENISGIAGFEINISCPNVKVGMAFGQSPEMTFDLVNKLRKKTKKSLIIKLTPNTNNIGQIARSAEDSGADALSLINTVKARAYIKQGKHAGKWIVGGLSGPCIKFIALQKISEVIDAHVKIPIIGIGGICNLDDALDFFRAGASFIQVGTMSFINVTIIPEIINCLKNTVEI